MPLEWGLKAGFSKSNSILMFKSILVAVMFLTLIGCQNNGTNAQDTAQDAGAADESDQFFANPGELAGSHILIGYQGAARSEATRTKEEALAFAEELITQLQADPSQFDTLAQQHSDGPSGPNGGDLGTWRKGQMVPAFDTAIETLEDGAITTEPVETQFGYHIIRRNSNRKKHYGARVFFVGYQGAQRVDPELTRTKEEAEALAMSLRQQATPANFEDLALEHNDAAEGSIFLSFPVNDPRMDPAFFDTLRTLTYGEIGGPIEFPFGYGVLKRERVQRQAGSHILVAYQGAERANPSVTRTKEEAQAFAADLASQLQANPDQFEDMARENSDGPTGPRGGDLGTWFVGNMVPAFDIALQGMEVGDITTEPVETPFGFHIIRKNAIPE